MKESSLQERRWEYNNIYHGDDFVSFWTTHLSQRNRDMLFILGLGFDPRMCSALRAILDAKGSGNRECLLIEYDEGPASPSKEHADLVEMNRQQVSDLLKNRGPIATFKLRLLSEDGRRIADRAASKLFTNCSELQRYTDIVVDISAIPRGIYFPIITKLLFLLDHEKDKQNSAINLHIAVAEDAKLDSRIRAEGINETATYLYGFSADLELEADSDIPKVWIPILGKGKSEQLIRIYDKVNPDEICPMIPSPSMNPRRGDALIFEYMDLIFDTFRVEPRNIIFAAENNPFEVYRQILRTISHYDKALMALKGCRAVVSALSSKLLSIGALLAAYELKQKGFKVGISNIESLGYRISNPETTKAQEELFTLWLVGECYGA